MIVARIVHLLMPTRTIYRQRWRDALDRLDRAQAEADRYAVQLRQAGIALDIIRDGHEAATGAPQVESKRWLA